MQPSPIYVVYFALALGLGVTGDLAGCSWIRLPALWIPVLTACHYLAIFLAAVGFGVKVGLGAATVAGIAHVIAKTVACAQPLSEQGGVVSFLGVGLLAGFLFKRKQTSAGTESRQQARDEISLRSGAPDRGQIPVGFVRAVRDPLSAIESAGYVLEDSALPDTNQRELATIILSECHRLDLLIQVLEFGEKRLPDYRDVSLSSVLDDIVRSGTHLTDAAGIILHKAEGPGLRVICDSMLLEQAVLNLLANAIQVAEHGDEIILSSHLDKDAVMIEISNRRLGKILGQLGITMAAMPEGALHLNPEPKVGKK